MVTSFAFATLVVGILFTLKSVIGLNNVEMTIVLTCLALIFSFLLFVYFQLETFMITRPCNVSCSLIRSSLPTGPPIIGSENYLEGKIT